MKLLSWNISWDSNPEKIITCLKSELAGGPVIACLQEVTPSVYEFFRNDLGKDFTFVYSLDFRAPGKFDSKSRRLGVLIIASWEIVPISYGCLRRVPFPDRTCWFCFEWHQKAYTVLNLQSVTGANYRKGKSVQFDSFAEEIERLRPDIVAIDANEPEVDHYDISQMGFSDCGDKGAGARHFFTALSDKGLTDALTVHYSPFSYVPGEPLALSHITHHKERRRYDFIFVNTKRIDARECHYSFEKALASTAKHAIVSIEAEFDESEEHIASGGPSGGYTRAELLRFCKYYKGVESEDDLPLMAFYEKCWVDRMLEDDKEDIRGLIIEYVNNNLETFSLDDGVPLSLKALLYNRYQHWSWGSPEGFKEFYYKRYLNPENTNK